MALLLGGSWGAVVVLAAARRHPPPPRARALAASADPPPRGAPPDGPAGPVATGRAAGRRLPAAHPSAPSRRSVRAGPSAGVVALVAAAGLGAGAMAPVLVPVAILLAGWAAPRHRARAAERRRLRRLEADLPDTVDLLVLAVGSGCNVPLALAAAGRRGTGPLAAEVRRVSAEVDRGRRLAEALDDLPARAGEPTRALAGVLAGCERYGTAVLPALERLADEVRLQRRRRAEAAARRVPVTLLFPLVLCILPAFALLTVAPLIAGALRELRL